MALTKGDLAEIELAVERGVRAAIGTHERACRRLRFWQMVAVVSACSAAGGGTAATIVAMLIKGG